MLVRSLKVGFVVLLMAIGDARLCAQVLPAPPAPPLEPVPISGANPAPLPPPVAPAPGAPAGVEVLARGPVHEAFASLVTEPVAPHMVPRKPPEPIEELPPTEKPEGDVVWMSGYWAWEDDRNDFIWVSGVWRNPPPGKQWIAGYWRQDSDTAWQWVNGFWTPAAAPAATVRAGEPEGQEISYLPSPPRPPEVAGPGAAPTPDSFYVPGGWVWNGTTYAWRAGYWARVQPGYVWVPDHFRWTPSGYIYIRGYWDYAVSRRGVLYAPVYITPATVVVGYTYTPAYAVRDTVVVDALFLRPATCHYYFGDYYEPRYREWGYTSCVVYSQTHYDSIIVYERYERRSDPTWINVQINIYNDRCSGRVARPPRTLVEQRGSFAVVAPPRTVIAARGGRVVVIDHETRMAAHRQAQVIRETAVVRGRNEVVVRPGAPREVRRVTMVVPKAEVVRPGMVAPRSTVHAEPRPEHRVEPGRPGTHPEPLRPGTHPEPLRPGARQEPPRPGLRPPPPPAHRPPDKDKKDDKDKRN
jgi:WXXGXW repeat (2 copies)